MWRAIIRTVVARRSRTRRARLRRLRPHTRAFRKQRAVSQGLLRRAPGWRKRRPGQSTRACLLAAMCAAVAGVRAARAASHAGRRGAGGSSFLEGATWQHEPQARASERQLPGGKLAGHPGRTPRPAAASGRCWGVCSAGCPRRERCGCAAALQSVPPPASALDGESRRDCDGMLRLPDGMPLLARLPRDAVVNARRARRARRARSTSEGHHSPRAPCSRRAAARRAWRHSHATLRAAASSRRLQAACHPRASCLRRQRSPQPPQRRRRRRCRCFRAA